MMTQEKLISKARAARNEYMRHYRQSMTAEQKEKQREYHRAWREQNRDRMKEHQANYWIRKAESLKQETDEVKS